MLLDGVMIGGYRSFGREPQRVGPCSKVNLLVGPNNSGKSNVLRFLVHRLHDSVRAARGGGSFDLEAIEQHVSRTRTPFSFGLATDLSSDDQAEFMEQFDAALREALEAVLASESLTGGTGFAWFPYELDSERKLRFPPDLGGRVYDAGVLPEATWRKAIGALTRVNPRIDDPRGDAVPAILYRLSPANRNYAPVHLVPAIREVKKGEGPTPESDMSGSGLINRLAELERPTYDRQDLKRQFEAINRFLRTVTANDTATLEVPSDRSELTVHMDGKVLPLSSLGTGIHEVVILAAAATVVDHAIVCIEEPEIHLHPTLQRRLISYLLDETTNQYFVATHSGHLSEIPGVSVFHVRLDHEGQSTISHASSSEDRWAICHDLGYRASDLLQSNCVIWVEGPTDRIYVNHWISSLDPDLVEGIHYAIMFYGGRLLNHLAVDDPDVERFIELRRLNQNLILVMDSDRDKSPHQHLNDTKSRVRRAIESSRGIAWVTSGREIENYVAAPIMKAAVKTVRPTARTQTGRFDRVLPRNVDKLRVARAVADMPADLDVLDLKDRIREVIAFIEKANV